MDHLIQYRAILPECDDTKQYEMELTTAIETSVAPYISVESITSLIVDYCKIGKAHIHLAFGLDVPNFISELSQSNKEHSFKQAPIDSISNRFSSLFERQPMFGDIVLFNNNYYGFIDKDEFNVLISTRSRDDAFYVRIPMEITHHMPNAAYFYNISMLPQYESYCNIHFQYIYLCGDDPWLRRQLELPIKEELPNGWRYQILLSSGMFHSVGDLHVSEGENTYFKTFRVKGYETVKHMRTYFKYASEPKITFKVRFVSDDASLYLAVRHEEEDVEQEYPDLLPLTWDRCPVLMSGGYNRYHFIAPKSQITQKLIDNLVDLLEPFMKKLHHNMWSDWYVLVGIVVIRKWGQRDQTDDWSTTMSAKRELFDQRIEEIFGEYFETEWKCDLGGTQDKKISKQYSFSECNIWYGPKCELKSKIQKLHNFEASAEHRSMQPWVKLEKIDIMDPLNVIEGLQY